MTESSFKGVDNFNISTRSWLPSSTPRAVVVIVPGFNSHSGYYDWVAQELNSKGIAAYAIDLRGRGKSDGERFYVQNFGDYVTDVASFVQIVKDEQKGIPTFILGHSAGGVVSCMYALEHQNKIDGLICESFAFQVPAPDFALAVLKGLSHIAPHAHVLKLNNEDFSRDEKAVSVMNNDPLIAHEVQPTQTVAEMVRADEKLKKGFPQITIPVLILHGTKDKATKPEGSRYFYEHTGSGDKTLKLYENHYHDLLNDLGKENVMADIQQWIGSRI